MEINPNLVFTANYFDSENVVSSHKQTVNLSVDGFKLELKGQINEKLYAAFGYADYDGETSPGTPAKEIPVTGWINYDVSDSFGYGLGFSRQGESQIKDVQLLEDCFQVTQDGMLQLTE